MKPQLMTITPKIAKQMLQANARNRQVSEPNVARLTKEMKSGRWKLNGDMIRRSKDGNILDGQHRLMAVVRSGVTIQSWVMDDVPDDVFDTIDVGKKRSTADTLSCLGEKNARDLAATLTLIERYMTGRAESQVEYSNSEMEGLLIKYPDVREHLVSNGNRTPLIQPSVLNCCHYLFSKKDPELANEFIEKVVRGIGLEMGDPWYVLRERLVENSISKAKLPKTQVWALCIKAWNYARDGKRISCLKLIREGPHAEGVPVVR
jgi:hypothetical protein